MGVIINSRFFRSANQLIYLAIMILLPVIQSRAVPKIILDTDIARVDEYGKSASDIDDLGALTILNALANRNECEILGIVTSIRSNTVVGMIDAVNTYFNNKDIPIGIKGGNYDLITDQNSYAKLISSRFSHNQNSESAASATSLIRQLLAEASDDDTIIYIHADAVAHWEYLNIGSFLESEPDDISSLTGWELFNQKVDEFVTYMPCMPNDQVSENCPTWNNVATSDATKLQAFLNNYRNIVTGNTTAPEEVHVMTKLWDEPDTNPIKVAYEYYYTKTPPPWQSTPEIPEGISLYGDPLGVLFSIRNQETTDLLTTIDEGSYFLNDNQKLRWDRSSNSKTARYFFTNPNQKDKLYSMLDALMVYSPLKNGAQ